jgi:hypothetical protein
MSAALGVIKIQVAPMSDLVTFVGVWQAALYAGRCLRQRSGVHGVHFDALAGFIGTL